MSGEQGAQMVLQLREGGNLPYGDLQAEVRLDRHARQPTETATLVLGM